MQRDSVTHTMSKVKIAVKSVIANAANRALFGAENGNGGGENKSLGFIRLNATRIAQLAVDSDAAFTTEAGVAWLTAEVYEGGGLRFVQPAAFRARLDADGLKMPSLGVHRRTLGPAK